MFPEISKWSNKLVQSFWVKKTRFSIFCIQLFCSLFKMKGSMCHCNVWNIKFPTSKRNSTHAHFIFRSDSVCAVMLFQQGGAGRVCKKTLTFSSIFNPAPLLRVKTIVIAWCTGLMIYSFYHLSMCIIHFYVLFIAGCTGLMIHWLLSLTYHSFLFLFIAGCAESKMAAVLSTPALGGSSIQNLNF